MTQLADTHSTTPADASHRHLPMGAAVGCAVLFGALNALQSRINGELGARIGDGFVAAVISFGSGLVVLSVAMLIWPAGRRGLGRVRQALAGRTLAGSTLTWWQVLGGTAGAFYVLSQSLTAAILGVALFTVAVVAGQTVSGLVMDRFGISPGGRRPLTPPRVIGAVGALVAVGLAVSGQAASGVPLWLMLMPLAAGFGQGWQQAVNGRVKAVAESALTATFVNFVFGTVALGAVCVIHAMFVGFPAVLPAEPWLYIGGLLGCIFIAGNAMIVRTTGVLVLGLGIVAGQLLCALALDLFIPTIAAGPVATTTVAGTVLALAAVGVVGIRRRSR
ncbi:DMT family transporter [Glaciibacter psychrotolerans]|uniref:Transporter family-2 protein n=1 Tax=Glaciibacter psychrotolerans TaxID=670054 RepID=A0A7Z0J4U6_9MICO|nr:DMT family transporter [Leifsonia psychrotolerans]NYJ18244.1 transporter family-2 protein [Leifsonia psychrotolerans]